MSYLVIQTPTGPVFLGDDNGSNQHDRLRGLPHRNSCGRYISAEEIKRMDEVLGR